MTTLSAITTAEALPIIDRAIELAVLWGSTCLGSPAEAAATVAAAVIRTIPAAEALPAAEREEALHVLWWITSRDSPAEAAVEAAQRRHGIER